MYVTIQNPIPKNRSFGTPVLLMWFLRHIEMQSPACRQSDPAFLHGSESLQMYKNISLLQPFHLADFYGEKLWH